MSQNGVFGKFEPLIITTAGKGTLENPQVDLEMTQRTLEETSEPRLKACVNWTWALAIILLMTHCRITTFNHNTQFARNALGHRVGKVFDPVTKRMKSTEAPADSHITAKFGRADGEWCCFVHIYTVDDANGVPLRLMLQSERQHTSAFDKYSPQVWANNDEDSKSRPWLPAMIKKLQTDASNYASSNLAAYIQDL